MIISKKIKFFKKIFSVGPAMNLRYKPTLCGVSTPPLSNIFSLFKGWGQVDIYPKHLGLEVLCSFKPL